jgi:hypothetical protein
VRADAPASADALPGWIATVPRFEILIVNAAADPLLAGPALRAGLPALIARGWGRIVVLAAAPAPDLVALVRGAALAGADRGVTANLVRVDDDDPARAGRLVALLCGDGAAMLTGAVLPAGAEAHES